MTTITDNNGSAYPLTVIDRDGAVRCRVYLDAHSPRVIARARYAHAKQMIVSIWVAPAYRHRGIATAIVKHLWAEHPEAVGRYPERVMSHAMHGFLTALMHSENLEHCAPGSELRGRQ